MDAADVQQLVHELVALGAQRLVEPGQLVALGGGAARLHLQLGQLAAQRHLALAGVGQLVLEALHLGARGLQLAVELLRTGLEVHDFFECAPEQRVRTLVTHGLNSLPPTGAGSTAQTTPGERTYMSDRHGR